MCTVATLVGLSNLVFISSYYYLQKPFKKFIYFNLKNYKKLWKSRGKETLDILLLFHLLTILPKGTVSHFKSWRK